MTVWVLRVYRGVPSHQYWEEFELPLLPSMNLISAFMWIQTNPINRQQEKTTPIAWEQGCLEEVCGSCSMLVNGRPRQACSAIIANYLRDKPNEPMQVAPLTKFPLIRDLVVDRTRMFRALEKAKAWIPAEGSWDPKTFGPDISQETQQALYQLSTCMTCGCCSESYPDRKSVV
jgi:succinate dehydrogenase / fumarate reductase iron-sulfur subunit